MNDLIENWTYETIMTNEKLYGGDSGNPAIILRYLQEINKGKSVNDLTLETVSNSVAVSRTKNKILEKHPELDHRVVHKPRAKKISE